MNEVCGPAMSPLMVGDRVGLSDEWIAQLRADCPNAYEEGELEGERGWVDGRPIGDFVPVLWDDEVDRRYVHRWKLAKLD